MDRRERSGDLEDALLAFGEGVQAGLWTALPGIIQSFDPAKRTCSVQPAIKAQRSFPDGRTEWVALPVLADCPVQFPGGGGCVLTFPLKQGDECLVVFASRCIDAWWQNGGIQNQAELRMHDLSDGFCIPGISSVPKVQPGIDTTYAELRTDSGGAKVRINPTDDSAEVSTTGAARVTAGGNIILSSGGEIQLVGTLRINGELYTAHKHTGVTPGSGQTGGKA